MGGEMGLAAAWQAGQVAEGESKEGGQKQGKEGETRKKREEGLI